jgi:DNA-binding NarL/FixJ family response regulator
MPGLNGLEVAERIAQDHPETRVLLLSMHANEEYVLQALRAGSRVTS